MIFIFLILFIILSSICFCKEYYELPALNYYDSPESGNLYFFYDPHIVSDINQSDNELFGPDNYFRYYID